MNEAKLLTILASFLVLAAGCTSTSALGLAKADHVDAMYEEQIEMANSIKELQLIRADNVEVVQELLSEIQEVTESNALIAEADLRTNARMTGIEEQLEFLPQTILKELVIILATHLELEVSEAQQDVDAEALTEEPPVETETTAG